MLAIIFTAQANIVATTCLSSVIEIKVWYLDQQYFLYLSSPSPLSTH